MQRDKYRKYGAYTARSRRIVDDIDPESMPTPTWLKRLGTIAIPILVVAAMKIAQEYLSEDTDAL